MATDEMFAAVARSTADRAGVFEYDGETGYFYLYDPEAEQCEKVIAAIHILTGVPDFRATDIRICWDISENMVGLFIRAKLWAAFDTRTCTGYGGHYRTGASTAVPKEIASAFEQSAKFRG